jgi:hypothetical protein
MGNMTGFADPAGRPGCLGKVMSAATYLGHQIDLKKKKQTYKEKDKI